MGRYLTLLVCLLAFGCGGGGGGDNPLPPGNKLLEWDAPTLMMDNVTNCNAYRDIDHYELYASPDRVFGDNTLSIAAISPVSDNQLVESFPLNSLAPFLPIDNVDLYRFLAMKSVGIDGERSNYSAAIEWRR